MEDLETFMDGRGGVATVSELAQHFGSSQSRVRNFARDNGVRRAGATFVFDYHAARELGEFLDSGTDGEEDEDLDLEGEEGGDENDPSDEEE